MPKMILNMVRVLGMFTLHFYLNCKCKELKLNIMLVLPLLFMNRYFILFLILNFMKSLSTEMYQNKT